MDIQDFRTEIDKIDREIVDLYCRRASLVEQIGLYKYQNNLPIYDGKREYSLQTKAKHLAGAGFELDMQMLYTTITALSRRRQSSYVFGADMPEKGYTRNTIIISLEDKPGELFTLLIRIFAFGANITKIRNRPEPGKNSSSVFIELEYVKDSPSIMQLFHELEEENDSFRNLGIYAE